jgi:hypothetical protein
LWINPKTTVGGFYRHSFFLTLSAGHKIENGTQCNWSHSFNADEHIKYPAATSQPLAAYKIVITYSVI